MAAVLAVTAVDWWPLVGLAAVTAVLSIQCARMAVASVTDLAEATPHVFRGHGYQHPALLLRRLTAFGIFATFEEQFQQVWDTVRPVERTS